MKMEEFIKVISYLGMAYGKEYSQAETQQMYEFLKEYNYQTMIDAVKSLIRTSKFVPKIADIIEACENNRSSQRVEVVKYMMDSGYFKFSPYGEITDEHALRNYDKAMRYLETNNVPDWFQEDLNHYYKLMQQEKLTTSSKNLLN